MSGQLLLGHHISKITVVTFFLVARSCANCREQAGVEIRNQLISGPLLASDTAWVGGGSELLMLIRCLAGLA